MSDKVGPNSGPVKMQKSLAAGEKLSEAVACATTLNGSKGSGTKRK